jgi:hypothetical protein
MEVTRGDSPTGERRTFLTGPHFGELLVFGDKRSTAKHSNLEPGARRPPLSERAPLLVQMCACVLVGPLEREWFLCSGLTEDPTCPHCRASVDWNEVGSVWAESLNPGVSHAPDVTCASCRRDVAPWSLDWREMGGFARIYLEVQHIHQGEAAPSEELLAALAEVTGSPWSFLYSRI